MYVRCCPFHPVILHLYAGTSRAWFMTKHHNAHFDLLFQLIALLMTSHAMALKQGRCCTSERKCEVYCTTICLCCRGISRRPSCQDAELQAVVPHASWSAPMLKPPDLMLARGRNCMLQRAQVMLISLEPTGHYGSLYMCCGKFDLASNNSEI